MPGYVTHYIFGREVYHNLKNNSLKKNLYYNRAAYGLGLQGPDIFFYYLPSYVLEGHNIGALAHVRETSAFFQGLIESRNQFSSRTDLNIASLPDWFSRALYLGYNMSSVYLCHDTL